MHLTTKQIELLTFIAKGPCDLDEILDGISYETSKQSLQFSVRALIKKGLIVKLGPMKRRGRTRAVVEATELGAGLVGVSKGGAPVGAVPSFIETEEDALLDSVGPQL